VKQSGHGREKRVETLRQLSNAGTVLFEHG
jgi:hypothetical protein